MTLSLRKKGQENDIESYMNSAVDDDLLIQIKEAVLNNLVSQMQ
jgi:hypothetical protein